MDFFDWILGGRPNPSYEEQLRNAHMQAQGMYGPFSSQAQGFAHMAQQYNVFGQQRYPITPFTAKEKHDMEQTIKVDRIDKKHVLIQVGCTKKLAHNPKEFYKAVIDLVEEHVIGQFWDKKGAAKAQKSVLEKYTAVGDKVVGAPKDPTCR